MHKLLVCVVLFAGMIAFTGEAPSVAVAQTTKKDKDTKKGTKGTKAGSPSIDVTAGKDGKFRFFVRNSSGKLLAMSGPTGFKSEKDALKAIEELKEVVSKAKVSVTKSKTSK